MGIARRATEQHRTKYYKLRDMDRHDFLEIEVDASAPMVGRTLMEFPCSDTCLVVAVHRGDQTLMAHGTTKILPGDRVTAYVLPGEKTDVLAQFLGPVSPDKFEDALN